MSSVNSCMAVATHEEVLQVLNFLECMCGVISKFVCTNTIILFQSR